MRVLEPAGALALAASSIRPAIRLRVKSFDVVEVAAVGVNVIAIGRKFGALDPGAIGVAVEIVTRPDRAVHVGDDDAVSLLFGRVLGESAEWSEGEESACCGGNEDTVPKV